MRRQLIITTSAHALTMILHIVMNQRASSTA